MQNSRWGIIYCPKQGVYHSHKRWERIRTYLTEQKIDYDFVQSEGIESVTRLTKMLCENGYRTIIIVGGDSALNYALNALLSLSDEVRTETALGIIPNGRGNDFAGFWGFSEQQDKQTVEWLAKRRLRKVDVGYIRYEGMTDETKPIYFLNCINVGLTARIMKLKSQTRRVFGLNTLTYLSSAFLLLFQRMEHKVHFRVNEDTINRKVMSVCVGSCRGYGQTPNAVPYNGCLDVSVISHPELTQLFNGLWMLFTGRLLNHKNVKPYRTPRTIIFEDIHGATVSIDGIVMPEIKAPMKIGLKSEWINFIIPD